MGPASRAPCCCARMAPPRQGGKLPRQLASCLAWAVLLASCSVSALIQTTRPDGGYEGAAHLKNVHLWKTLEGTRDYIDVLDRGGPREQLPPVEPVPPQPRWATSAGLDPSSITLPAAGGGAPVFDAHKKQHMCDLMMGPACAGWWSQSSIPLQPPPQGNRTCANNCNNAGTCNADIGECQCTAGFGGKDCTVMVRRPCSQRLRDPSDPLGLAIDHTNDMFTHGWTASRCAGECDDVLGLCHCGYNSTYGRVPAPPGSPWGTPPIKKGIPLAVPCQPATDAKGQKTNWGHMPWDTLYGPRGWCNAPQQARNCPCALENQHGPSCETLSEAWCPNQCNLRGRCNLGFCHCDEGWYGTACDRMREGTTYTPVDPVKASQFKDVWREPPHSHQPLTPTMHRKRPFIYVYDIPAVYNVGMIQIKNSPRACNWRMFNEQNQTEILPGGYQVETYLHEALLASTHRTLDPEEADFFYVPIYYSCYAWPIFGWSDGPWFHPVPSAMNRPLQGAHMYLGAKRWLEQAFPYWNRSQGSDHIFLNTHDEGACWMPSEIYNNAIMFTHWGRTDPVHESGTAYPADNYTQLIMHGWERHYPDDWRTIYEGHVCYTPGKDLLVPNFKDPSHFKYSPLLGSRPLQRDILMYFKGDCGLTRLWWYSRGIRQTLFRLALEDNWWGKYKMIIVDRGMMHDTYSESLARSKFCLVAPGDGYSPRAEDAILHGCIPVVIQDNVEPVFYDVVDWSQFSIRVPQANMTNLPQILQAVSEERIAEMQAALAKVWHRFAYATGAWHRSEMPNVYQTARQYWGTPEQWSNHTFKPLSRYPVMNDAFHTIMQWLYGKIKNARLARRHKNGSLQRQSS